MGIIPSNLRTAKRPTFHLREDVRRMSLLTAQAKLLSEKKISTREQLELYLSETSMQMELLKTGRKGLYHRIRRCRDNEQRLSYKANIADLTKQLSVLRREVRLGEGILVRSADMQTTLRQEQGAWRKEEQKHEHRSRGSQSGREYESTQHRGDGQDIRRRR
ncbi:hypothetical protein D3C78_1419670 [compost metagenome]